MFFETPIADAIAAAIRDAGTHRWDTAAIRAHADAFRASSSGSVRS